MKIVVPGGSGHLGGLLVPALLARGDEVVVLGRGRSRDASGGGARHVVWDGVTQGPWAAELDGADAVIGLAGRSVDCRYTKANLAEMFASRIDSVRAVGEAIAAAKRPPRVWLQSSTATIYAHRFDAPNDEATGVIGGHEPDAPAYWRASIEIARAWERELADAPTPHTRRVALRTAIVTSTTPGTAFRILLRQARLGLGGPIAGGAQYLSWIHQADFVRAVLFLLDRDDLAGAVNVAAPHSLPHRDFARALRAAAGAPFGLPMPRWLVELGTVLLRTDSELVLKSRRVVPGRLLAAGFRFELPEWPAAARDLVERVRTGATRAPPAA